MHREIGDSPMLASVSKTSPMMKSVLAAFVVVVVVVACSAAEDNSDRLGIDRRYEKDLIAADIDMAQCQLRCLLTARDSLNWLSMSDSDQDSANMLPYCQRDDTCSSCLVPCQQRRQLLAAGILRCHEVCMRFQTASCSDSDQCCQICENRLQTAELESKLCSSSTEASLKIALTERKQTDGVEVVWTLPPSGEWTDNQQLYIVYWRSSFWPSRNLERTAWEMLTSTTSYRTAVDGLTVGRLHQFHVIAVDVDGCQTESNTSESFTLTKEPGKPGAPVNVTEGETIIADGQIAIEFHWSPPSVSDIPVSRYKIYWSIKWPTEPQNVSPTASHEYRQVVPAAVRSYRIENLEPNHEYRIQVQAICQIGETKLKGNRSTIIVRTPTLSQQVHQRELDQQERSMRPAKYGRDPWTLTVSEPYFNNGLLKANVTWSRPDGVAHSDAFNYVMFTVNWTSADSCSGAGTASSTSQRRGMGSSLTAATRNYEVAIYDLMFNCRYLVQLQLVSTARSRDVSRVVGHVTMTTPDCRHVAVIGDVRPDCSSAEPSNVRYLFVITATNITAKISWNPASTGAVMQSTVLASPVIGYQVTWSRAESTDWFAADATTSVTRTLPSVDVSDKFLIRSRYLSMLLQQNLRGIQQNSTEISIGELSEAATYAVYVRATSSAGVGRPAVVRFTTPRLQQQQQQPGAFGDDYGDVQQDRYVPLPANRWTTPTDGRSHRRHGVRGRSQLDQSANRQPPLASPADSSRLQTTNDDGDEFRGRRRPSQVETSATAQRRVSSLSSSSSHRDGRQKTELRPSPTMVAVTSRVRSSRRTPQPLHVELSAATQSSATRYRPATRSGATAVWTASVVGRCWVALTVAELLRKFVIAV